MTTPKRDVTTTITRYDQEETSALLTHIKFRGTNISFDHADLGPAPSTWPDLPRTQTHRAVSRIGNVDIAARRA
jgi:hypothetical protein